MHGQFEGHGGQFWTHGLHGAQIHGQLLAGGAMVGETVGAGGAVEHPLLQPHGGHL